MKGVEGLGFDKEVGMSEPKEGERKRGTGSGDRLRHT